MNEKVLKKQLSLLSTQNVIWSLSAWLDNNRELNCQQINPAALKGIILVRSMPKFRKLYQFSCIKLIHLPVTNTNLKFFNFAPEESWVLTDGCTHNIKAIIYQGLNYLTTLRLLSKLFHT